MLIVITRLGRYWSYNLLQKGATAALYDKPTQHLGELHHSRSMTTNGGLTSQSSDELNLSEANFDYILIN